MAGLIFIVDEMVYQEGYVYHIKDEYRKETAFLLQNMFPVRNYYLDHIHTRNNNPVPVKHTIHKEVSTNMKRLRQLHVRGKKVVFPNIDRLVQRILNNCYIKLMKLPLH